MDPLLFMYKILICVAYEDNFFNEHINNNILIKHRSLSKRIVPVISGNNKRESWWISSYVFTSRPLMMENLIFIKHYWLEKYQKWKVLIILMGYQQPPGLVHLVWKMRMVLRLRDIGPTNTILSFGWCCIWNKKQDKIFNLMFIGVHDLPTIPTNHKIFQGWVYLSILKAPRKEVWC